MHRTSFNVTNSSPPAQTLPVMRHVDVSVSRLSYMLVDDSSGSDFPLLDMVMEGATVGVQAEGGKFTSKVSLAFAIEYYNPEICDWEPLLEKVDMEVHPPSYSPVLKPACSMREGPNEGGRGSGMCVCVCVCVSVCVCGMFDVPKENRALDPPGRSKTDGAHTRTLKTTGFWTLRSRRGPSRGVLVLLYKPM